jgi:hypothetical protein
MANGHGGRRAGAGRKQWQPTDRDRRQVEAMCGYGIPIAQIASLLDVDHDTLAKHCHREIATGATKVHAQMGQLLVTSILARQPPGEDAVPIITDEKVRGTLLMFYCKTKLGYKDVSGLELTGKDGAPLATGNVVLYLPDNGRDPDIVNPVKPNGHAVRRKSNGVAS